ncbi:hypothetical protein [Priestia megaterium]|uniref:hypothetical protein n=1 Tax=Priestia megaterium TaxID=1404 RepID=UPI0030001A0C
MTLEQLIDEAETLKSEAKPDGFGIGLIIPLEDLERWVTKCVIYIDENGENAFLNQKVQENAKDLAKHGYQKFSTILGVLKGIKESA